MGKLSSMVKRGISKDKKGGCNWRSGAKMVRRPRHGGGEGLPKKRKRKR